MLPPVEYDDAQPKSPKRRRTLGPGAEAARTSTACANCRKRKIKCSGQSPCRYCAKQGLSCTFADAVRKKLYSIEYVQQLEAMASTGRQIDNSLSSDHQSPEPIISVSENLQTTETRQTLAGSVSELRSLTTAQEPLSLPDSPAQNTSDSNYGGRHETNHEGGQDFTSETVASSSLHFSNQITSLRMAHSLPDLSPQSLPSVDEMPDDLDIYDTATFRDHPAPSLLQWPSPEEAHELLDIVLKSIGKLQHLIEPRLTSDRLSLTYKGSAPPQFSKDLWYNELLMIFSLGELLRGRQDGSSRLPGMRYFIESERCLPCIPKLRAMGYHAVGVLCMMAFYLQCADSRKDAYVYAALAMKLAIASGMADNRNMQTMTRSETTHRTRLWWTVYMQERRLAAANGHPASIQDGAIKTRLPTDSPGFESSGALNSNIKLAKITGQTMQAIYGHESLSARSYIRRVNKILADLLEVAHSFPSEYTLDLTERSRVSRIASTLHLMLYQCIMLATRPSLLHLAKTKLGSGGVAVSRSEVSSFEKLADACIEAAGHCLKLLQAMQDTELIAIFGFFDLDATFSAAFVFVLVESIYPHTAKTDASAGIQKASAIMHFLAAKGNMAAARRRTEIGRMCHHLGIDASRVPEQRSECQEEPRQRSDPPEADQGPNQHISRPRQSIGDVIQDESDVTPEALSHFDWAEAAAAFFHQPVGGLMDPQDLIAGLSYGEGGNIASSFNLEDFTLTGIVETDWEDFSKQLAPRG